MKKQTKRKNITQTELAEKLGISRQLLSAHIKKGDTPPLEDTEAWEEYLLANGRGGGALANASDETKAEFLKLKMRLMDAQARRLEVESLAREEKLIDFEGVKVFIAKYNSIYFRELERIAQDLPVDLPCKDHFERVAVHQAVNKHIGIVRSVLKNHIAQFEESKGKVNQ